MNTKKLQELRARHAEVFHAQIGRTDASDGFMRLIDAILEPEPAPETVVGEHLDLIVDAYEEFRRVLATFSQQTIPFPQLPESDKKAVDAFALRLIERVRSERRAPEPPQAFALSVIKNAYDAFRKEGINWPSTWADLSDSIQRAFIAFADELRRSS